MPANRPNLPDSGAPLLVGREREMDTLRACLDAAFAGRGGLVLIGGEAGIGKTALAEAICREAAAHDATVLIGRCYDLSETPPYGPWVELFGRYHAAGGLITLPDAFAQRGMLGEVTNQSSLFRQVLDFLAAVSTQQPLVVLLDDFHWADPASLDLLRVVARSLTSLPLLIAVTYRTDELTRRHALYQMLPLLVREASATRIDLQRIDHSGIRALVTARYALSDADVDRLVGYLHTRSDGNPFFLGELLHTLEAEDALDRTAARCAVGDLTRIRVPMLLRQVIDNRFVRLDGDARQLLTVAAVIGQEILLRIWEAVADTDDDTLAAIVEQAIEAHILDASPDGTSVHFVHALIREALYESIIPVRRSVWHRRVGDYLLAQPNPDPDTVADHLRRAGDSRAAYWLARAGERAEKAYAWLTAIARYEAALALMSADASGTSERGWLLYCLARMVRYSDPQRGLLYIDEAAREAARCGDVALAAATVFSRGVLRCYADNFRQGIVDLQAGVAALGALPRADMERIRRDAGLKGDVRGTLIVFLTNIGRFDEARVIGEGLVEEASEEVGGDVYQGLRTAYALLGRPDDARAAFRHACAFYRAAEHFTILGVTILNQIDYVALPYRADDVAERVRLADEGERAYRLASGAWTSDTSQWARMPLLLVEGAWEEAEHAALIWLASGSYRWAALGVLGPLARQRGDRESAWAWVRDGIPAGLATVPGEALFFDTTRLQRLAAALATDAGDLPTARPWLEAHDRWLAWSGAVLGRAEGALGWATYYRAAGETRTAYRHATDSLAHATEPRQPLVLLAAHRVLGELATDAGNHTEAQTHLAAAVALSEACAAPYERALTLLAFATLHLATGDTARAAALLDEIRAICLPLGAKLALARADALAACLAAKHDPLPVYPDRLTAREVDVLRLIASGGTNQEIAATLFLSIRTVERHITSVYRKTETRGRAGIAAYALRHGLITD